MRLWISVETQGNKAPASSCFVPPIYIIRTSRSFLGGKRLGSVTWSVLDELDKETKGRQEKSNSGAGECHSRRRCADGYAALFSEASHGGLKRVNAISYVVENISSGGQHGGHGVVLTQRRDQLIGDVRRVNTKLYAHV